MKTVLRSAISFLVILFIVGVGLYPVGYLLGSESFGILTQKPTYLLQQITWKAAFYLHIIFGGISLLVGWTQFSAKIRNRNMPIHRLLGKVYVLAVTVSGFSGFYVGIYAMGGLIAALGFCSLAVCWLLATLMAYQAIKKKKFNAHERWMTRSYALTLAAVMLRLWLPFMIAVLSMDFITAYLVVSWLCWVPNLIIAEIILSKPVTVSTQTN